MSALNDYDLGQLAGRAADHIAEAITQGFTLVAEALRDQPKTYATTMTLDIEELGRLLGRDPRAYLLQRQHAKFKFGDRGCRCADQGAVDVDHGAEARFRITTSAARLRDRITADLHEFLSCRQPFERPVVNHHASPSSVAPSPSHDGHKPSVGAEESPEGSGSPGSPSGDPGDPDAEGAA